MQFHPFARRFLALVLTAAFMTAAALSGFAVYAMPIQAATRRNPSTSSTPTPAKLSWSRTPTFPAASPA